MKRYCRWLLFPTYSVSLGHISELPRLISPSFLSASAHLPAPRTRQFQAVPTSPGPTSLDKCASPNQTNSLHHRWCKIETTQRWAFGCFLGLTPPPTKKKGHQRTLQIFCPSEAGCWLCSHLSLLRASFQVDGLYLNRMKVSWAFEPGKGQPGYLTRILDLFGIY